MTMNRIELELKSHSIKAGMDCPYYDPNVKESSLFYFNGSVVGFYLTELPKKINELLFIANTELLSPRVPKSEMLRLNTDGKDEQSGKYKYKNKVSQFSTIIGSVPPKPHMKRTYPTISSVHQSKSAQPFIKAMLMIAKESEYLLKEFMPEQYVKQLEILGRTDAKWRFGNLFTSSISNFDIAAAYHRDTGNLEHTVNFIYTKRLHSTGGALHVPDFGITVEQANNSVLVYPAWRNIHGVTPIRKSNLRGYRNSLVFYPLKAFEAFQ
jgi:hypothetical protein